MRRSFAGNTTSLRVHYSKNGVNELWLAVLRRKIEAGSFHLTLNPKGERASSKGNSATARTSSRQGTTYVTFSSLPSEWFVAREHLLTFQARILYILSYLCSRLLHSLIHRPRSKSRIWNCDRNELGYRVLFRQVSAKRALDTNTGLIWLHRWCRRWPSVNHRKNNQGHFITPPWVSFADKERLCVSVPYSFIFALAANYRYLVYSTPPKRLPRQTRAHCL